MPGRRKQIAVTRFSTGTTMTTFCLSIRITATGRIRTVGLVRYPYSNRPKKGGGLAVPGWAMNPVGPVGGGA